MRLERCFDDRGNECFMCYKEDGKKFCKCLSDTSTIPCPFMKTKEQVLKEDPLYYQHAKAYTSLKKPKNEEDEV